jgi:hypothetical protein
MGSVPLKWKLADVGRGYTKVENGSPLMNSIL